MRTKKRMLFGVIAAAVSDIAQRELLLGIIEEAKKHNIDIAVISNIINEDCGERELPFENIIYELTALPAFDAFIMLSEPFPCEKLREKIHSLLYKKNIPVVIVGASLPDFDLPSARSINISDENDMEEMVDHLIEEHGFTDIDMLTGYDVIDVSHFRVNGYKKSLEKHGIPFDESKVIYGDFWTESGKKLAIEYIEGRRPYPQALVCANDYMAFGLEDEFIRRNISITKLFSVVGFDFSIYRINHSPLLTSYQFNRKQLGRDAIKILYMKLKFNYDIEFKPPKGTLIHGLSCPCDFSKTNLKTEQEYSRINIQYQQWNIQSNMNEKITSCRTLDELMKVMGKFQFLVRYVQNIFVCLYENWYEYQPYTKSDNLSCRSIMPWLDTSIFNLTRNRLTDIIANSEDSATYYFNPVTFENRIFGYVILKCDNPDSYDINFKHWIKSLSIGLEFLRLKHDINYLLECQSVSQSQDTMTALKNDVGMKKAFDESIYIHTENKNLFFVMIKCCLFHDDFDIGKKNRISSILEIADALKHFASIVNGVCGRINDNIFTCILNPYDMSAEQIEDYLMSFITHCKTYLSFYGINSFLYSILPFNENDSYTNLKQKCFENIDIQTKTVFELYRVKHYSKMLEIRNEIYLNPDKEFLTSEFCQKYSFSPSYLRVIYKNFFGISFIQDCIASRVYRAKYLLLTTELKIKDIANNCGYHDTKYFLRQFQNCTGVTPNQYRTIHCNY